jgi:hypothetical protein
MHENEEAPEGYMEKEKEERKLGCRKGRNVLGFKESGSRQREREGGSREDATTPTNF